MALLVMPGGSVLVIAVCVSVIFRQRRQNIIASSLSYFFASRRHIPLSSLPFVTLFTTLHLHIFIFSFHLFLFIITMIYHGIVFFVHHCYELLSRFRFSVARYNELLSYYRHDESYSWQMVNCCVHNIIVGTLWIEHVS